MLLTFIANSKPIKSAEYVCKCIVQWVHGGKKENAVISMPTEMLTSQVTFPDPEGPARTRRSPRADDDTGEAIFLVTTCQTRQLFPWQWEYLECAAADVPAALLMMMSIVSIKLISQCRVSIATKALY